ncbi:MAG: 2-phosphosulfolactate phosphatase [Limisphaerales bacterium]
MNNLSQGRTLEVLFTPAEFAVLPQRDLAGSVCVVFDILRATTSMVTALGNGADAILPVSEIAEALEAARKHPGALLAGERDGLRIRAAQTGSVDFDLGNSPREFTSERVRGKKIVMTTTNGTRALQSCKHAARALAGSFLNLAVTAGAVQQIGTKNLIVICAGTFEEAAYEDTLAAGALCQLVWGTFEAGATDAAHIAREVYLKANGDLMGAFVHSRNARRLLSRVELNQDVAFCAQRDTVELVAELKEGAVRCV